MHVCVHAHTHTHTHITVSISITRVLSQHLLQDNYKVKRGRRSLDHTQI